MFNILSPLIQYISNMSRSDNERLPPLPEIGRELGVSVSKLREQLEVAKALGIVEIKPRLGIRVKEYAFDQAVILSASYAVALSQDYFHMFSDLRDHVENAYWFEAVPLISKEGHNYLLAIIDQATRKLESLPIQIPHLEHQKLHMYIFSHIQNPFVTGILNSYWMMYEEVGLNIYADYSYLRKVWDYHEKIVHSIINEDFETGYIALREHKVMLSLRENREKAGIFE